MNKTKILFILVLIISCLIFACSNDSNEKNKLPDRKTIEEVLMGTNILMLEVEDEDIDDFVRRYGWDVNKTGSGLRYDIYHKGDGEKAKEDQTAVINYSVRLLTGDLIYSSKEEGEKLFRVGRGGVESGLEEGILKMRVGDKARFIMPPHLAHGFPGDGIKIPKRATIVYDVELIGLK